jgi:hypothetical protein
VLAHDATWILAASAFCSPWQRSLRHRPDQQQTRDLRHAPGRAFWLRWSPRGDLLRFTVVDPIAHTSFLGQLTPGNRKPQLLLAGFSQPASEGCGVWSADGNAFVFQSSRGGSTDLWELRGSATEHPLRLTDGPCSTTRPPPLDRAAAFISRARGSLRARTLSGTGGLTPADGFLSDAVRVDYTRDGHWVAWTDPAQAIDRISIPDGRVETVSRLAFSRQKDTVDFVFVGLTHENEPLIRARIFTGNIHSLDLKKAVGPSEADERVRYPAQEQLGRVHAI